MDIFLIKLKKQVVIENFFFEESKFTNWLKYV